MIVGSVQRYLNDFISIGSVTSVDFETRMGQLQGLSSKVWSLAGEGGGGSCELGTGTYPITKC